MPGGPQRDKTLRTNANEAFRNLVLLGSRWIGLAGSLQITQNGEIPLPFSFAFLHAPEISGKFIGPWPWIAQKKGRMSNKTTFLHIAIDLVNIQ